MKEFATLRAKRYSSLTDQNNEGKKAKGTKKFAIKRKPIYKDFEKQINLKIKRISQEKKS